MPDFSEFADEAKKFASVHEEALLHQHDGLVSSLTRGRYPAESAPR